MSRRRFLLGFACTTLIVAGPAVAEQKKRPVIGFLGVANPSGSSPSAAAFQQGLREAGYVDGQNVQIEYRWAEGHNERLPALAAELVGRNVDVIFTNGGFQAALAAKNATATIPIVFETGVDPVERGLVASYARPGGNLTGVVILTGRLMPKRLEVLVELIPQARTIAFLVNPNNSVAERTVAEVEDAAQTKRVQLHVTKAAGDSDFGSAFASIAHSGADALLVGNDPVFFSRREELIGLAERYRIPAVYEWREFVTAGGLASYGTNIGEMFRLAGIYVGRILSGARPADLPILQPTKFELAINLKTARALGLTVPPAILDRADEVIE
jgi:ABC-type uncharacterized transport system substrate-binding protein